MGGDTKCCGTYKISRLAAAVAYLGCLAPKYVDGDTLGGTRLGGDTSNVTLAMDLPIPYTNPIPVSLQTLLLLQSPLRRLHALHALHALREAREEIHQLALRVLGSCLTSSFSSRAAALARRLVPSTADDLQPQQLLRYLGS